MKTLKLIDIIEKDYDENYKDYINELNNIKSEFNIISTEIAKLSYRENLIVESMDTLNSDRVDININQIKNSYTSVNKFIPDLQKTFEEFLIVHNCMIDNKIKYVANGLPCLREKLSLHYSRLNNLLDKEKELTSKFKNLKRCKNENNT